MDPLSDAPTWASFVEGWELFRPAVVVGAVAGAVLGFLSVYVVLRRMVFVSAAVTQAAGLGVALAFFAEIHLGMHVSPDVGGAALALGTTLLLMMDPARLRLTRESVLGLAYALTGGLAILVGNRITQEAHDIQGILFGTGVVVSDEDFALVLGVGALVLLLQLWWFRGFTFASFDRVGAHVQGLPVRALDGALMVSIGLMVGICAHGLGALPVFAFSTLPAIAALALDRSLPVTFAIASVVGAACGAGGYVFAYLHEHPVGGAQTVAVGAVVLAFLVARAGVTAVLRRRAPAT